MLRLEGSIVKIFTPPPPAFALGTRVVFVEFTNIPYTKIVWGG